MTVYQGTKMSSETERWIYDASGRLIYWGEASAGSHEDAEVWRICKYAYTGDSYNSDSKKWAGGTSDNAVSWTGYSTHTYS